MRRAGIAVVAVAALISASACSSDRSKSADAATQAGSSVPSTAVDGAPQNEDTSAGSGTGGAPGAPSTSPPSNGGPTKPADKSGHNPSTAAPTTSTTAPSQSVSGSSNFPLDVSITPMCVTPGKPLSIVVTTRAYASIAAALAFSDNDAHGAYTVESTPPDGVWRWNVVVSPDAPTGPAKFIISAQDRAPWSSEHGGGTNGEGKKGTFPFEVRSKC